MGSNPSTYTGNMRPVENVSYQMIRGSSEGLKWPSSSGVDSTSFMGKLRTKTGLATIDLPTEAQWEYTCRAEKTTALNSGKDATDDNMKVLGRFIKNSGCTSGSVCDNIGGTTYAHTVVGNYAANSWDLYDMHGNVEELCLDWYKQNLGTATVTDPKGPTKTIAWNVESGNCPTSRGGSWRSSAAGCRCAQRSYFGNSPTSEFSWVGFRVFYTIP